MESQSVSPYENPIKDIDLLLCDQIRDKKIQHCVLCRYWEKIRKTHNGQSLTSYGSRHMRLLCLLLANEGKILSKEKIIEHVWPEELIGYNSVLLLIHDIRIIISDFTIFSGANIINVRKKGYMLYFK